MKRLDTWQKSEAARTYLMPEEWWQLQGMVEGSMTWSIKGAME